MVRLLRRIGGVLALLLGSTVAGWIGYNLFVERQEEAKDRSPLPALILVAGCFYVGNKWIRGQPGG